jgi:hypothetical protein
LRLDRTRLDASLERAGFIHRFWLTARSHPL